MADRRHVDAARGDIGGHQHADAALAQVAHDAVAGDLGHVAMQRGRGLAGFAQSLRQFVGGDLGRGEHDRLSDVGAGEDRVEQRELVAQVVDVVHDLGQRAGVDVNADLDPTRVARDALRDMSDPAVQRGREQHGLAGGRQSRGDRLDLVDKAHVEHAIGLVQHQQADGRQVDAAALEVIGEPARGGDDDVDAFTQRAQLRAEGRATDQADGAQAFLPAAVAHGRLLDLQRELAGRGEDQHARRAARAGGGLRQARERRPQEGGGLAAAGLGRHQQVVAFEEHRDRGFLDRRGLVVAELLQRLERGGRQAEREEPRRHRLRSGLGDSGGHSGVEGIQGCSRGDGGHGSILGEDGLAGRITEHGRKNPGTPEAFGRLAYIGANRVPRSGGAPTADGPGEPGRGFAAMSEAMR